jgi:hypothetical protein
MVADGALVASLYRPKNSTAVRTPQGRWLICADVIDLFRYGTVAVVAGAQFDTYFHHSDADIFLSVKITGTTVAMNKARQQRSENPETLSITNFKTRATLRFSPVATLHLVIRFAEISHLGGLEI